MAPSPAGRWHGPGKPQRTSKTPSSAPKPHSELSISCKYLQALKAVTLGSGLGALDLHPESHAPGKAGSRDALQHTVWLAVAGVIGIALHAASLVVVFTAMPVQGESPVQIDVGASRLGIARLPQPLRKGHSGTAQT